MHDVRAIGRKFPGSEGFSLAASFGIRRITPSFQACGIEPVSQHELYRSMSADNSEGQFFKIVYET